LKRKEDFYTYSPIPQIEESFTNEEKIRRKKETIERDYEPLKCRRILDENNAGAGKRILIEILPTSCFSSSRDFFLDYGVCVLRLFGNNKEVHFLICPNSKLIIDMGGNRKTFRPRGTDVVFEKDKNGFGVSRSLFGIFDCKHLRDVVTKPFYFTCKIVLTSQSNIDFKRHEDYSDDESRSFGKFGKIEFSLS
jgi:hypothetical protein